LADGCHSGVTELSNEVMVSIPFTRRLFLLVQAFGGITVAEFSSRLPPNERQRTMKEFEQGKIQL